MKQQVEKRDNLLQGKPTPEVTNRNEHGMQY